MILLKIWLYKMTLTIGSSNKNIVSTVLYYIKKHNIYIVYGNYLNLHLF